MYVRYISNGRAVNKFIGLHELESGDAAGVLQAVDQILQDNAGISRHAETEDGQCQSGWCICQYGDL